MPTIDVLLIGSAALRGKSQLAQREPPLSKSLEVSPGIHLASVRAEIAQAVFQEWAFRPLEPGDEKVMYGFVRYDPPGKGWDEDLAITKALYLSHLVRGHLGGFEFAGRVETDDKSKLVDLAPFSVTPCYGRAYPCRNASRPWLTQADGEELRALILAYDAAREYMADKRLGMAVSLFGDSPFIYQGRPRVAQLAGILEGLVNTSAVRSQKQFVVRVPELAAAVGLPELNTKWAQKIYQLRSKLAHGTPLFQSPSESRRREVDQEVQDAMSDMDELLRRILKRALTDRPFADLIHEIDRHWPIPGNGCAKCRSTDTSLVTIRCPRCNSEWQ